MLTTRRSLITGLASLLAAPAIVRASSIMPVKVVPVVDCPVIGLGAAPLKQEGSVLLYDIYGTDAWGQPFREVISPDGDVIIPAGSRIDGIQARGFATIAEALEVAHPGATIMLLPSGCTS